MKAEEKRTTAGLLGKLHYGVSEFLDEATCLLHPRTSELKDISARLLVCFFPVFWCVHSIQLAHFLFCVCFCLI